MRLQDKVVLVKSAQDPCAEAILTGFAREGEDCVIVDQDGSKAEQLAAEVRSVGRRATLTDQGEYRLDTGDFFDPAGNFAPEHR